MSYDFNAPGDRQRVLTILESDYDQASIRSIETVAWYLLDTKHSVMFYRVILPNSRSAPQLIRLNLSYALVRFSQQRPSKRPGQIPAGSLAALRRQVRVAHFAV